MRKQSDIMNMLGSAIFRLGRGSPRTTVTILQSALGQLMNLANEKGKPVEAEPVPVSKFAQGHIPTWELEAGLPPLIVAAIRAGAKNNQRVACNHLQTAIAMAKALQQRTEAEHVAQLT